MFCAMIKGFNYYNKQSNHFKIAFSVSILFLINIGILIFQHV